MHVQAEHPCRHCMVGKSQCSDPHYDGIHQTRLASDNEKRFDEVCAMVEQSKEVTALRIQAEEYMANPATRDDDVGRRQQFMKYRKRRDMELRKGLRPYSLHHIKPALWSLPFGAHKGGVNSATPPDVLHQLKLGLMKRASDNIRTMLKEVKKSAVLGAKPKKRSAAAVETSAAVEKQASGSASVKKGGSSKKGAGGQQVRGKQLARAGNKEYADRVKKANKARAKSKKGAWARGNHRLHALHSRIAAMNTRHNGKGAYTFVIVH